MSRLPVRKKIAYFRMRVLVIATEVLRHASRRFLKDMDPRYLSLPSALNGDERPERRRWIVSRPEIYSVV